MFARRGNEFLWPPANEVYKDERARTEMDTRREFWVARASVSCSAAARWNYKATVCINNIMCVTIIYIYIGTCLPSRYVGGGQSAGGSV